MTFRLLNFSMTSGLRDKNSAEFQALASEFCQYVSKNKQHVDLKLLNIRIDASFDEFHEAKSITWCSHTYGIFIFSKH